MGVQDARPCIECRHPVVIVGISCLQGSDRRDEKWTLLRSLPPADRKAAIPVASFSHAGSYEATGAEHTAADSSADAAVFDEFRDVLTRTDHAARMDWRAPHHRAR
jgi:hypothetical protein